MGRLVDCIDGVAEFSTGGNSIGASVSATIGCVVGGGRAIGVNVLWDGTCVFDVASGFKVLGLFVTGAFVGS